MPGDNEVRGAVCVGVVGGTDNDSNADNDNEKDRDNDDDTDNDTDKYKR